MEKINLKRKDKLIDAAIDEFIEKSFDDASLNNILKRAGISKGSFYYHFKNKQDLYLYIYDQVGKDKITYLNKALQETVVDVSKENIFTIFRFLGKTSLKFAAEYPKYFKLGKRIFSDKNEEIRALVIERGKSKDNLQIIETLIKKAIDNNELRDDFPVDFTTKLLKNLLISFSTIFLEDIKDFELDRVLEIYNNYIDFIENGLGKKNKGC
ncbi:TetR/AcrR family transcriptional regulator [Paramaledivibacter caminithermalis]|uniref:Transcriptional regulator, TetR family n=1 Tax=Paramaledivibacter caminithermalis (strain DSM 15212 / CIP 107654 / DViRD3) TaxID=1121301 RepID=A0A1M6PW42_PARC5|nr:TetR/AcrR family transcriptional regulator [Paramaledivibacter caminithermalis]SHK12175.1 transcriptional regulator, TetR family [Paramaledivibacter caminithermalis DSM 15212]